MGADDTARDLTPADSARDTDRIAAAEVWDEEDTDAGEDLDVPQVIDLSQVDRAIRATSGIRRPPSRPR